MGLIQLVSCIKKNILLPYLMISNILKTVVQYILSDSLIVSVRKINLGPVALHWPEEDINILLKMKT